MSKQQTIIEVNGQDISYFNADLKMQLQKYVDPKITCLRMLVDPDAEPVNGRRPAYMKGIFQVDYDNLSPDPFYIKTEHYVYSNDTREINEAILEYKEKDHDQFTAEGYDVLYEDPPMIKTYKYQETLVPGEDYFVTRIRFRYNLKLHTDIKE